MLRNYDRHLSPVRRHRRLCHGGADPADSPTVCAAAGHGARRLGFRSLQLSAIRSTRQFPGVATDGWLKRQSGDPREMDRDTSNRAKGGFATRAIHVGHRPADGSGALTPPVFMTSTYAFETAEAGEEIFRGEREGYVYGRTRNPTQGPL